MGTMDLSGAALGGRASLSSAALVGRASLSAAPASACSSGGSGGASSGRSNGAAAPPPDARRALPKAELDAARADGASAVTVAATVRRRALVAARRVSTAPLGACGPSPSGHVHRAKLTSR